MFQRYLLARAEELLCEFRILYLTGPRQSGKTTIARAIAEKQGMTYVTLDDQATLTSVRSDPHGFIRSMESQRLVIDEFQYAPELIPAIKAASDRLGASVKGKFLLTGSTDIFRSANVQESLPGHMARLELMPLSCSEINENTLNIVDYLCYADFSSQTTPFINREQLAQRILLGGYPEVQDKSERSRQTWFRSYIEGRLFKDFETLHAARGDYYSRLQALVPALAGLSGNLLKYANLANDLELNDEVVKSYCEILEPDVLLKSQFYGGLLENLIYMECYKQAGWADEEVSLMHFRDTQRNEVDLVMERADGGIIGVEIKASASFRMQDFRGLAALAEHAGSHFQHGVLIYTGDKVLPVKMGKQLFHAVPAGLFVG